MKQANFLIPDEVLREFRRLIPRGEQSRVVSQALQRELKRRHLEQALKETFGAWKGRRDMGATRGFVRKLRKGRF